MKTLYDPQDVLKILRLPEKTESNSVFILLKTLVLPSFYYLKQLESCFSMKTMNPLKKEAK